MVTGQLQGAKMTSSGLQKVIKGHVCLRGGGRATFLELFIWTVFAKPLFLGSFPLSDGIKSGSTFTSLGRNLTAVSSGESPPGKSPWQSSEDFPGRDLTREGDSSAKATGNAVEQRRGGWAKAGGNRDSKKGFLLWKFYIFLFYIFYSYFFSITMSTFELGVVVGREINFHPRAWNERNNPAPRTNHFEVLPAKKIILGVVICILSDRF